MRQIRIAYVDFWRDLDPETFLFTKILRKHYDVIIDQKNPDYVFCSVFGTEYLNYSGIRILFMGEGKAPDFNLYDYAMAFDEIQFSDRYLRYPFFLIRRESFEGALKKHTYSDEYYLSKKKFCNFVVSNNLCNNHRERCFEALSEYKKVDSGGRHKNNLPDGKPVADKLAFQKEYKFSLAFENSSFPGYVTEKIMDAWAAGTVPIYWGDPHIEKMLNPKAFINCNDFQSMEEMVEKVREIDEDDSKFLAMMKEPIMLPGSVLEEMIQESYLESFLLSIVEQPKEHAFRRNSKFTMWGDSHEHHLLMWSKMEKNKFFIFARDFRRNMIAKKKKKK